MLYKDIRISDVAKRKQIGLALKYISVSPIFRGIIDWNYLVIVACDCSLLIKLYLKPRK